MLRAELNQLAPSRSTRSDGAIGDQSHAVGASDHNPNASGVVCARDFTHDPAAGADMHRISRRIVAVLPAALKYVIWNRQIWSRARAADGWRTYTGPNPHTRHMHVSVGRGPDGHSTGPYDDTSSWGLVATTPGAQEFDVIDLEIGDEGEAVKALQYMLRRCGFDPRGVDGIYGKNTAAAVLAMRRSQGSDATDGNRVTGAAYDQLMVAFIDARIAAR